MWPVVQFYFSNMSKTVQFQLECGFHAAGGIFVVHNFSHLEGNVQISGSSAEYGGAVLRCSSWVLGTILRWL